MSDPGVSERRIRPIQDAISGGNWKQALQLCDKWSKKGERSDRFLAVKAFVLVNHADKSQHDRGKTEVLDLCKRSPPVTEPEAIYQLQTALKTISLHDETSKLWERALTAKKDDKDLYTRWLNQAIADSDWRSAQKATMGMRNNFPKERHYEFWNILMCHLISRQESLPEKDRTLFGTLAYRMMTKAAEAIPVGEEQTSSAKAVADPEEMALLAQVFNSTGHAQETVKLLRNGPLNLASRLGKKDPQLVLSLLLESLELSEDWDEALEACDDLLSKSEHHSDDRIWNLWLKARSKSKDQELLNASKELLESVCGLKPVIRPAYLARLTLLRAQGNDIDQASLLEMCKTYYHAYSDKGFCFDDLKASIQQLDKEHRDEFIQIPKEDKGNFARLFALKVEYSWLPSSTPEKSHTQNQAFLAFAYKALTLHCESTLDPPACPEASVLAALAILRIQLPDPHRHQPVLFAMIILELARIQHEDYYILTILLIQLQAHLGLLSMAMDYFTKLSVKNLQWETVGHLILTRISTLHPAFKDGENAFDALRACETGVTVLENADNALVRGIREGLRFNSYSNIYNSVNTRSQIERSMNQQIYAIEERKISRWRATDDDDHTVLPLVDYTSKTPLVDKRDFDYLPAYRTDDRDVLDQFRCGPSPKQGWINAMALLDNVSTYLEADLTSRTSSATTAYENMKILQTRLSSETLTSELESELTQGSESDAFDVARTILAPAIMLLNQGSTGATTFTDLLTNLGEKLKSWSASFQTSSSDDKTTPPSDSKIAGIAVPTWDILHDQLTHLEILHTIATFLTWILKKQPQSSKGSSGKTSKSSASASSSLASSKETILALQALVKEVETAIHERARALKAQLNEPGILGRLVDLGMCRPSDTGDTAGDGGSGAGGSMWDILFQDPADSKDKGKGRASDAPPGPHEWEELLAFAVDNESLMESICGWLRESWDDALDGILFSPATATKAGRGK